MDRNHAVVIGGSISGMCAARVLARSFAKVTVVERDELQDFPEIRKGAPQGHHVHAMLAEGARLLEAFFPGIDAELAEAGAPQLHIGRDVGYLGGQDWARPFEPAIPIRAASRPLIEQRVRRRVMAMERVTVQSGRGVQALLASSAGHRVNGVILTGPNGSGEERLPADLVVDASGRGTRAPQWLEAMGHSAPKETVVDAFVGYSTRLYEDVTPLPEGWKAVFLLWTPEVTRGGVVFPMEGGRWFVTIAGVAKDYPPSDEEGFLAFAKSLRGPHVADAIAHARPLTEIHATRSTANRWLHFERLADQPPGFVVLGDAACAFNPIYGQGMTVAVSGAALLGQLLERDLPAEKLPRVFQRALAARLRPVWTMSTSADFLLPSTQGERPLSTRAGHAYFNAVLKLGSKDADVTRAISRVLQMLDPPGSLMRPGIALRALAGALRA
jgi:2-polyprenyl-6-methoxyphenol hydroxylase-like FAD-dependent oxidoreductase